MGHTHMTYRQPRQVPVLTFDGISLGLGLIGARDRTEHPAQTYTYDNRMRNTNYTQRDFLEKWLGHRGGLVYFASRTPLGATAWGLACRLDKIEWVPNH